MPSSPAPDAPASLVAVARACVEVDWTTVQGEALCAAAEEIAAARRLLDAALVAITARLDDAGAPDARQSAEAVAVAGWASVKDYLTHLLGGHRGAGSSWVRTARHLRALPEVGAALAAGGLSFDQARTIGAAVATLPRDPVFRARVADQLLGYAAHGAGPGELRHALPDALRVVDPDGVAVAHEADLDRAERAAHHARFLSITPDGLGGARIKGYTSLEDATHLRTALDALAAPRTTEPGACGGTPRPAGTHPLDTSQRTGSRRCPDPACDHTGRDPREPGARLHDALLEICHRITRLQDGPDQLPRDHGTRPRVIVTINEADLRTQVEATVDPPADSRTDLWRRSSTGRGEFLDGTRLSTTAVRRLACDAEIIPAVLGSEGEVLDVGRAKRLVTPALWTALLIRDRHCAFPGCTRKPVACEAHHIRHWADGGATCLDNLILLCGHHHRLLHHTPWRVHIDPDTRRPVWTPPPTATGRSPSYTIASSTPLSPRVA